MLKLRDFVHLPELDELVSQIIAGTPGLVLVAGAFSNSAVLGEGAPGPQQRNGIPFLSSGRSTIATILFHELLESNPHAQAVIIAQQRGSVHFSRAFRQRVSYAQPDTLNLVSDPLRFAMFKDAQILFLEEFYQEHIQDVILAARQNRWVLGQADSILWGYAALQHLVPNHVWPDFSSIVRALVTVQRLPGLCQTCRQPAPQTHAAVVLKRLLRRFPELQEQTNGETRFYISPGCKACRGTGRQGQVAVFDVFTSGEMDQPGRSRLPLEGYAFQMALRGLLALDDLLWLESNLIAALYSSCRQQEQAAQEMDSRLNAKLIELAAANRVLQQRTEVLMSLEDFGQTLTSSTDLASLAGRVCRRASELCGADRAVLYLLKPSPQGQVAEVLAFQGWRAEQLEQQVDAALVLSGQPDSQPTVWKSPPPGLRVDFSARSTRTLKAGLKLALIAHERCVGVLIVHSSQKNEFTPGAVALLQTFANQAAVGIQRAGLIDELRAKITQLEAAQLELLQKERMEQELAIARQVQQSMLPRRFPVVKGLEFAARYEPARQVGGDFYDVFELGEGRIGLVIGDVSDKGMPAALYMALCRSLIRAEARRSGSPGQTLLNVNDLLLDLGSADNFVSVFLALIDTRTMQMDYIRAGHEHPYLLRKRKIEELPGKGTVLGIMETQALALSEERIDLLPGDRLVLYTDGVIDLSNPAGENFGQGRFRAALQAHGQKSPVELCDSLFADLERFRAGADPYDDITLLVVETYANQ